MNYKCKILEEKFKFLISKPKHHSEYSFEVKKKAFVYKSFAIMLISYNSVFKNERIVYIVL